MKLDQLVGKSQGPPAFSLARDRVIGEHSMPGSSVFTSVRLAQGKHGPLGSSPTVEWTSPLTAIPICTGVFPLHFLSFTTLAHPSWTVSLGLFLWLKAYPALGCQVVFSETSNLVPECDCMMCPLDGECRQGLPENRLYL